MISIIVPVYKVEQYLSKCVDSILNQTYQDIEIILVDDGSPDNCPAICDDYVRRDKRVKVIHKINGGLSDARNAGLDIASGEYIFFVDSDDWIEKAVLKECFDLIVKESSDAVITMFYNNIQDMLINVAGRGKPGAVDTMDSAKALTEMIFEKLRLAAWGNLYKKSLFEKHRFKKGFIYEDFELLPRLILSATKVTLYYKSFYNYLLRDGSIMRNNKVRISNQLVEIAEDNIKLFKKSGIEKELSEKLVLGVLFLIMSWYEETVLLAEHANKEFAYASGRLLKKYLFFVVFSRYLGIKRKLHYKIAVFMPRLIAAYIIKMTYKGRKKNG